MKRSKTLLTVSFIALFAAIVCIGCFLRIPLGPVPIVLQNALCVLTGVLLGGVLGGTPTALWLVAGLIGLPVYSGGTSGLGVWAGPTGGFLPGYLIGAIIAGFIAGRPSVEQKKVNAVTVIRVVAGLLVGMVVLYIPGVFHFSRWALQARKVPEGVSAFAYTMKACVVPFIPGDLIKFAVCIPVALAVRPVVAQYLYSGKKKDPKTSNEE
ncbi:biotin transporter BioY [Treponema sp.]|uniref:biotin transporter BioY n=1 Tax=Treponema sp. TaxID=166 RepID=UPI00298DC4F5|nr:biotin transporter BioY [Treponema sp.]